MLSRHSGKVNSSPHCGRDRVIVLKELDGASEAAMKRVPSVMCATIALIGVSIGEASAQDDLRAAFDASPPGVRELQCRDIAALADADRTNLSRWLEQLMAPVSSAGMSMDEIHSQFLADCSRDQGSSVVAAAVELRKLLEGLTPQHAGGK